MKIAIKSKEKTLAQQIANIEVNKNLKRVNPDSPLIKKKMEKGEKLLAAAGFPKFLKAKV